MLFARSDWFIRRWLASTIHLRAADARDFKIFERLSHRRITFSSANYSACVVYIKTIIHLSVGESGGYNIHHYSPPLRWIIVNYNWACGPIFFCLKRHTNEANGSIQSSTDRFASFARQTNDNCNNSYCNHSLAWKMAIASLSCQRAIKMRK